MRALREREGQELPVEEELEAAESIKSRWEDSGGGGQGAQNLRSPENHFQTAKPCRREAEPSLLEQGELIDPGPGMGWSSDEYFSEITGTENPSRPVVLANLKALHLPPALPVPPKQGTTLIQPSHVTAITLEGNRPCTRQFTGSTAVPSTLLGSRECPEGIRA